MTVVVGLVEKGVVHMGADSIGIAGYDFTIRRDEKLFRNGEFLIGVCGSFRMRDLLCYSWNPPEMPERMAIDTYMRTGVIDSLRECFKAGGYASVEHNVEEGGNFLLGFRGRLFEVECDFQVGEAMDGMAAIGCGDAFAKGALHATPRMKPKQRIMTAMKAAERFCAGVRGPFHYTKQRAE